MILNGVLIETYEQLQAAIADLPIESQEALTMLWNEIYSGGL